MPKKIINNSDWLDWLWSMMKARQDKDMTNRTSAFYAENKTEMSWPIGLSAVCDENHPKTTTWSIIDSGLHWKHNWAIVIDRIGYYLCWKTYSTTMWLIVQVQSMLKTILNYCDRSNERTLWRKLYKTMNVTWFVPNWCLSWFVSSWCSLIERVINKIYNLYHHALG